MKKLLASAVLLLGTIAGLFAANDVSASSLSFGLSFPQIYDFEATDAEIDSEKYAAFGINFALRGTIGMPFGLYADGNIYWLYAHKITVGSTEYDYDLDSGSWGIQGQFGIYSVFVNTGRFLIPFGAGLHLDYAHAPAEDNIQFPSTTASFSVGIGGWINAELTLTEKLTLYGGVRLNYDFWRRLTTKVQIASNASQTNTETGMTSIFSVIPVFGLVFRF